MIRANSQHPLSSDWLPGFRQSVWPEQIPTIIDICAKKKKKNFINPTVVKFEQPTGCGSSCVHQVVLGFVGEADYQAVAQALRHRVSAIIRQRERQRRLPDVQEAESHSVRTRGQKLFSDWSTFSLPAVVF